MILLRKLITMEKAINSRITCEAIISQNLIAVTTGRSVPIFSSNTLLIINEGPGRSGGIDSIGGNQAWARVRRRIRGRPVCFSFANHWRTENDNQGGALGEPIASVLS